MLSTRNQFLLVSAAYLLSTPVSAQGWWANNGANWNNGNGGCPPWVSSDECNSSNNSNNSNNGGSNNGSGPDASQYGLSSENLSRSSRIITFHAVLACLVWVFLIPSGSILLRLGINSPWIVRIHAVLQSVSCVIYIVAVGMGVWLVHTFSYDSNSLWSDPHPKIGIAILFLAFFQPIFGQVHYRIYKKRAQSTRAGQPTKPPGRTAVGYLHLWLGRLLIGLGMVNGGLGLRLAAKNPFEGNTRPKIIAYGVGTGIMFLLYLVFVVFGEIRRSRANRELSRNRAEASRDFALLDADGAPTRGTMPPTYTLGNMPPSYEVSQQGSRKEAETTTRYS